GRRRALQVRVLHAGRRTGDGGIRRVLAQGPERQAYRVQGHSRRGDAVGGAEARRDRHRLLDPRRARRGAAEDAGAHPQSASPRLAVALLRRPVGPEIAVARRAANLAMDREGINQALTLGRSHLTNSVIPESFEFYWPAPPAVYDPAKAKELLAEAGHPNGFDAGEFFCDASYSNVAEALLNN